MSASSANECSWEVDGLHIAGLAWGSPENPPLLALHGWLDNANSFAMLAPLLDKFYVVALDLTGHGKSSRRSADASYQVYDDLPQIIGVVEQLGWERFDLMGHSRGAIIASLLAASFPERIHRLVLLDGVAPPPLDANEFVDQMRRYVLEKKRLQNRRTRVYASEDLAVSAREEQGLNAQASQLIVSRNLMSVDGGYTWTTDPRLRGASAMKMTTSQVDTVLQALHMPTLLLMADEGLSASHTSKFTSLGERIPGVMLETFPGGHHFHMEQGVATLATRIQLFLASEEL
ncbi:MAG: alpha/beta hydrolase [Halioglobus sp.]